MKVTIKEVNGLNLTKGKLYTTIKEDWRDSTMTVIDDLGQEFTGSLWDFFPAGEEFNSSVCLSKEEIKNILRR